MNKLGAASALVSLSLLCATAAAQGHTKVWKVAATGGDFSDLQSAVNAAQDGDLLLVRSGVYPAFQLHDKALSILPAQGAAVNVTGETHVEDLSAGKLMVISNIACKGLSVPSTPALVARHNAGALVVRNSSFVSVDQALVGVQQAARLLDSDVVVFDHCQFSGGNGSFSYPNQGGQGLFARRARMASFRSIFRGGNGGDVICGTGYWAYNGGAGGSAFECPEGFLFAAGGSFDGGRGGDAGEDHYDMFGNYFPPGQAGAGGHGVLLGSTPATSLDPHLEALATTASGGSSSGGACGNPGYVGQPYKINNGSMAMVSGTTREILLQPLAYESSSVPVSAIGAAGETVYLMVSRQAAFTYDVSLSGVKLLQQPTLGNSLALGVVPAGGVLQGQMRARLLPPLDEGGTFLIQALFVSPGGTARLSNATALAVVDTSIPLN